jgi:hypothetical protein
MSDFEATSRKEARACARAGTTAFALAFNTANHPDTEWRYSDGVLDRVHELCAELNELIESGDLEVNPRHAAFAMARDARKNVALQTLIRKASSRTAIRKTGHE